MAEQAATELEERLALEQKASIITDEEDRIARVHEEDNGNAAAQELCDDVQETVQESSNEPLPQQDFEPTVIIVFLFVENKKKLLQLNQ